MKAFILSALVALSSAAAFADAPVTCSTNVDHDPRAGTTYVTIVRKGGVVTATQVTHGGLAHFVTAPKTITVTAKNEGPELVIYSNSEEGFELEVSYQPIGGAIRGTLIADVMGARVNEPVVCSVAQN